MKSFETVTNKCPNCNVWIDACSNMTSDECPQEGDPTVCLNCSSVLKFGPNLEVLPSSLEEFDTETQDYISTVLDAISEVKLKKQPLD